MAIEHLDDHRARLNAELQGNESDDFLIREGLDLLATFRKVKSEDARMALIALVRSIVEAERRAEQSGT